MTKDEHVYAICCRLEVDGISSGSVKITKGYVVVNFEVASASNLRDITKSLCDS